MPKAQTAQQIADSFLPARITDQDELPLAREAKIVQLDKRGLSQSQIAQEVKLSQSQVSRILSKYVDTTDLARIRARAAALELADRVIADADVDQSLEVLDRLEVLSKRDNGARGTAVQIHIGMPGQPVGPDPLEGQSVIDLSPSVSPDIHRLNEAKTERIG